MLFPEYRPRRMRRNEALRRMIRETELSPSDFILPLFAVEGKDVRNPIPSMPGHYQQSVDHLVKRVKEAADQKFPLSFCSACRTRKTPWGPAPTPRTALSKRRCAPSRNAFPT
jgi:porphobilinogen synthase